MNEDLQQIGPYTIDVEIGRGGMGVVYRAVDGRLEREVAIKALPDELADQPDRLARFQNEARTLASLNHANVAGIHGVEEHDGRWYLVLELVDGETLAHHLTNGSLPIDDALDICAQIAAGVAAAHDAGVIHRDLKPANVKLTTDGKVKVLDFGLAKTGEGNQSSGADLANSPTMSIQETPTAAGVILGTAPYMSPEQARGRRVDRRSDVWSFGVVLYECLTGATPFTGETVSDAIAAILHAEIDFDLLPAATPPSVRRLLRRCLEREVSHRYRDIGDVRLDLVEAREGRDEMPGSFPTSKPKRSTLAWAVAAIALLALIATLAWVGFQPSATPTRLVTDIVPIDPEAEVSVRAGPPAITPDGEKLAFVVERRNDMSLMVRDLTTGSEELVATSDEIRGVFWSPDSRSLAYFDRGRLMILAPGANRPEAVPGVLTATARLVTGAWAPNGTIIFGASTEPARSVLPFEGEPEVVLDPLPDSTNDRVVFPSFLPEENRFLFLLFEPRTGGATGLYVGVLGSEEFEPVLRVPSNGIYTPQGWLYFSRSGGLQAQRYDPKAGRLQGEPMMVANDLRMMSWPPHGLFTVSHTGRVAYIPGGKDVAESEFVWIDRSSGEITPLGVEGSLWNPSFSPDGRYLAFDRTVADSAGDIWLRDLDRGIDIPLVAHQENESYPVWTPDGQTVVFFRGDDLYRIAVEGSSDAELILESTSGVNPWGVTPDGRTLLFNVDHSDGSVSLWTLDLETLESKKWLAMPNVSPFFSLATDGRWVATSEPVQDRLEVFIRSFPDGKSTHRVSIDGGDFPRWSRDGTEIFFSEGSALMSASFRQNADGSIELGRPERIGALLPTLPGTYPFEPSPDGSRFLTIRAKSKVGRSMIRLIENWESQR